MRPYGDILLELEVLREEMIDDHDVQLGDMLYELYGWTVIHRPDAIETYVDDNSKPIMYYGPKENLNEIVQSKVGKSKK